MGPVTITVSSQKTAQATAATRTALRRFCIKLFHWEYWPFHVVYGPMYIYWAWLSLKARSFFFFNAANPGITNGGFLLESKKQIYDTMPEGAYPRTAFFHADTSIQSIQKELTRRALSFPLIAKPDTGMRGMQVKVLHSLDEAAHYATNSQVDFLIQEYISYKHEAGIFYYCLPGETRGHISGIVGKEFLSVTGDGLSTIEALLLREDRYTLQLPVLQRTHGTALQHVLPKGKTHVLVPYGNHSRGAKFIDLTPQTNAALSQTLDRLCQQIPGFHFGRLDIRYNTWEELCAGKNFSVIELNGAGSEPTHIYDPTHSLFFAWKEIARHLNLLYRISRANHRQHDIPYMSTRAGLKMLRDNARQVKLLS